MVEIEIFDEVNFQIRGLSKRELEAVQKQLKFPVKGAFMQYAFQLGEWDGKESLLDDEGYGFIYHLDVVGATLEDLGFEEDEVKIIDSRETVIDLPTDPIDENYLLEELGYPLRDYQVDLLNSVITQQKGIIDAATNAGKCHDVDTMVMTPNGWRRIGDIVLGDYVIGKNGKKTKVTGVFPQGKKPIYKMTTEHGKVVRSCNEHLWAVRTKYDKYRNKGFRVLTLQQIMNDLKNKDGSNKWQLPNHEPIHFNPKGDILLHPYVMGFLIGDGSYNSGNVKFSNTEEDVISKLVRLLPPTDGISRFGGKDYAIRRKQRNNETSTVMSILKQYGLFGSSLAATKKIPESYLYASVDERVELLQGLMDTDGYVDRCNTLEYVTVSPDLTEQIKFLVSSLGGYCSIGTKDMPTYEYNGEKRIGQKAYRLYINFGDSDIIPVSSQKHLKKFKKGRVLCDTIKTIDYVGEMDSVCISVDADDSLYIVEDFTVTHNTSVAVGIAKYYQDYIQTLTIVPNEKLLNQICKDFEKAGFDYAKLSSKVPVKKRPEMIRSHKNIVITSKLLVNVLDYEDETGDTAIIGKPFAFINDETHTFGDTMYYAMRAQLFASPVRIGLTGTVPKDKLKREKLVACLGGDELDKVSAKFLMDNGYAAKTNITMYQTFHPEVQELSTHDDVRAGRWEWDKDESYYSNHERLEAIAEFIKTFDDGTNTLILCHAATGNKLKEMLELEFIDKDTPIHERDRMFEAFDEEDNVTVLASYGTSSTGISQNNIFRGFLIDIGKDETTIKQSIGRFMRLDGVIDRVELIDIYADSYYAKKHAKERIKIYKREGHPYLESKEFIMV